MLIGNTVIFLHGGPGEGTSREHTLFFNPKIYRVILFDQRGAGKSTPHAELRENTAQLLVDDIETLRERFQIPKWHMVFGGSWGSCLGLLYAQTHPGRVGALVLRGICTFRKWELDWFYQTGGAPTLFPEFYENLRDFIPPSEQGDLLAAYHKRLNSPDPASRRAAARQWTIWELSTVSLLFDPVENLKDADDDDFNAAMARLETHYFINGAFMDEGQLLKSENTDRIRHIPSKYIRKIVCCRFILCLGLMKYPLLYQRQSYKVAMMPYARHK